MIKSRLMYTRSNTVRVWEAFGVCLACCSILIMIGCTLGGGRPTDANPVELENAKRGDPNWILANPALDHEIEGYASFTSIDRGESIKFFVSTAAPSYSLEVFRMGWYGGAGARKLITVSDLPGMRQPIPAPDPDTGLVECRWQSTYTLAIPYNPKDPTDWLSGVYLVRLTASLSQKQSYIMFVVRDDRRFSAFLFQSSVTTHEAYNNWGGKSLYDNGVGGPAVEVSFNRPYAPGLQPSAAPGVGAGEFLTTYQPVYETYPAGWEYNMVRFLERNGYDVAYDTDIDQHENPTLVLNHKALLVVGHDEYWSMQMRNNVLAARDRGINLGFFAANVCFWQIRLEPSSITSAADRTQVCYKDDSDPVKGPLETVNWRTLGMPEDEFIGVMYGTDRVRSDIFVQNTQSWVFASTGLHDFDRLKGILGYEVDAVQSGSPENVVVLAASPVVEHNGRLGYANMTTYTAASGGVVFATGSMHWNWGIDDYNAPTVRPSVLNEAVQQITHNVLHRLGGTNGPKR